MRLAKSLDRETLDKHVLKVTAYERVDPTVSTSTTVVVDVVDVQDNSPIFERDSYFADIREDAPVSQSVIFFFARPLYELTKPHTIHGYTSDLISINCSSFPVRFGLLFCKYPLLYDNNEIFKLSSLRRVNGEAISQCDCEIELR